MNWTAFLRRLHLGRSRTVIDTPDASVPDDVAKQAFAARIKATLAA